MAAVIVSRPDGNGGITKDVIAAAAISSVKIEELTKSIVFEVDGGSSITIPMEDETVVVVVDAGKKASYKSTCDDLDIVIASMLV